jgi:hypothetical protein
MECYFSSWLNRTLWTGSVNSYAGCNSNTMPKVRWRAEFPWREVGWHVELGRELSKRDVAQRLILVTQEVLIQLYGMSQLCGSATVAGRMMKSASRQRTAPRARLAPE